MATMNIDEKTAPPSYMTSPPGAPQPLPQASPYYHHDPTQPPAQPYTSPYPPQQPQSPYSPLQQPYALANQPYTSPQAAYASPGVVSPQIPPGAVYPPMQTPVVLMTAPGVQYQQQMFSMCAAGHHDITTKHGIAGIILAVVFFPIGLLCLFADKEKRCVRCGARF